LKDLSFCRSEASFTREKIGRGFRKDSYIKIIGLIMICQIRKSVPLCKGANREGKKNAEKEYSIHENNSQNG
jgi:hypothetical protein